MNPQPQSSTWLTDNLADPGFRQIFYRELLAESAITPLDSAIISTQVKVDELAKRTGISQERLQQIFSDPIRMTLAELAAIALALNLRSLVVFEKLDSTYTPKVDVSA